MFQQSKMKMKLKKTPEMFKLISLFSMKNPPLTLHLLESFLTKINHIKDSNSFYTDFYILFDSKGFQVWKTKLFYFIYFLPMVVCNTMIFHLSGSTDLIPLLDNSL